MTRAVLSSFAVGFIQGVGVALGFLAVLALAIWALS